jgi:hypothetical protein
MIIIIYFDYELSVADPTMRRKPHGDTAMTEHTHTATIDELQRSAFNAAFYELGLRWYWDDERYAALAVRPCERERVRSYVETEHPHLLRAYDADFIVSAVEARRPRATPG